MSKESDLAKSAKISPFPFYPTARGLSACGQLPRQSVLPTWWGGGRPAPSSSRAVQMMEDKGAGECGGSGGRGTKQTNLARRDGMGWNYILENSNMNHHNFLRCKLFIQQVFSLFPKNDRKGTGSQ